MTVRDAVLAFAHVGDLHLTDRAAANAGDFLAIVEQINAVGGLACAYLPGDNVDDGLPEQYAPGSTACGCRPT